MSVVCHSNHKDVSLQKFDLSLNTTRLQVVRCFGSLCHSMVLICGYQSHGIPHCHGGYHSTTFGPHALCSVCAIILWVIVSCKSNFRSRRHNYSLLLNIVRTTPSIFSSVRSVKVLSLQWQNPRMLTFAVIVWDCCAIIRINVVSTTFACCGETGMVSLIFPLHRQLPLSIQGWNHVSCLSWRLPATLVGFDPLIIFSQREWIGLGYRFVCGAIASWSCWHRNTGFSSAHAPIVKGWSLSTHSACS